VLYLGVTLDCVLTFAIQIYLLNNRNCFYQLRTVTRSFTVSSTSTLTSALYNVHAFFTNRLDYCCGSFYAGHLACGLRCLDRDLRSAARLIGGIPKFGHASRYKHDVLRWLPAEQRRIASLVWRCLLDPASVYLRELSCPCF